MSQPESRPFPHWRVWKTVDALKESPVKNYERVTNEVVSVLKSWGFAFAGLTTWRSLLDKRSLQHEVEESIVALHHLKEWMDQAEPHRFVPVDVCCGKGLFSMLLSYLTPAEYWNMSSRITKIILLDKATDIDWYHIEVANQTRFEAKDATNDCGNRPELELWKGVNLHKYDSLLDRFQALLSQQPQGISTNEKQAQLKLAFTGIHLCKMLGPAFLSLVNGLGDACSYLCLSPCCLPRLALKKANNTAPEEERHIYVHLYETPQDRRHRLQQLQRRDGAMGRNRHKGVCYLCQSPDHWVRQCTLFPEDDCSQQRQILAAAAATTPCWNCGVIGHFQDTCPNPKPTYVQPPRCAISVTTVLSSSSDPYRHYCQLLAQAIPDTSTLQVVETGLTNSGHQEGNWNSNRKSIYIVAYR